MSDLYHNISLKCSKEVTQAYSTSFSSGIRLFAKKYRAPIYAIYGFVRFADEIVDTFYNHDQRLLLDQFKEDTKRAIDRRLSLNPILNAFQWVVHDYGIDWHLISAFIRSMEMDLEPVNYNSEKYREYIYGSAEVVGLMCLKVFVEGDGDAYDRLKYSARKLGSAFQKINFLRDMQSDYKDRGRVYFPGVDYESFSCEEKRRIEAEIEEEFRMAFEGIKQLPDGTRLGVYVAYKYYTGLLKRIQNCSAEKIREQRIRVPDFHKLLLLSSSAMKYRLRVI